jgi:hypothetical protein
MNNLKSIIYLLVISIFIETFFLLTIYLTTNKIKQEYRSLDTRINLLEMSVMPGYFDKK